MHEVDQYLNTLIAATPSKMKLYNAALNAWKKYTKENLFAINVHKRDVNGFIFWCEEQWKPNTVIDYLVPFAQFLEERGNLKMKVYILKRIKELRASIKTRHKHVEEPMIFDTVLEMLKIVTRIQHKLCLWLLTIEGMSNRCLAELRVGYVDPEKRTYKVPLDSGVESGRLHRETMRIIEKRIDEDELNPNDRLVGVSENTIQNWVRKYAEMVDFRGWKDMTPNKLRQLGSNAELREVLIREYKKTEKKS